MSTKSIIALYIMSAAFSQYNISSVNAETALTMPHEHLYSTVYCIAPF